MKKKMRVMISQPMCGLSEDEIRLNRVSAVEYLESLGHEVVDTVFDYDNVCSANVPLFYLSKSLQVMSTCDAVMFIDGWESARGCKIEHDVCLAYGVRCLYQFIAGCR